MKIKKSKIWFYYCKKLSKQPVITLFYLFYSLFLIRGVFGIVETIKYSQNWQEYLLNFWFISLFQFGSLFMIISYLVSKIIKPNVKKGDSDDVKISLFTPGINREAIIFNKYKAIATYFFLINLLFLTLPIFFYFLSLSLTLAGFSFLLLNGLIFALVNFLFLVPLFFWISESYSNFFVYFFLFFAASIILTLAYIFFQKITSYPLLFPALSFPLSGLVGYLFFSLHRKKFLTKDLL